MAAGITLSPFWNFLVCASVDILAELGDQLCGLLVFAACIVVGRRGCTDVFQLGAVVVSSTVSWVAVVGAPFVNSKRANFTAAKPQP